MSSKDVVSNSYMANSRHFADAFNFFLYQGKQVIKPDDLMSEDSVEEAIIHKYDKVLTSKKIRDVFKGVQIKTDGNAVYALLGIENQSDIHYAMPVRNLFYDALDYASQVATKSKENRKGKRLRSGSEFLSGYTKEDKVKPVITLVINWSKNMWDGPTRLSEMIGSVDENLVKYINDYTINLIDPHNIDDFEKFHTELGDVLNFIKVQNDKEYLNLLRKQKGDNWKLDVDSVIAINTFTGAKIRIDEAEGGMVDMCEAIKGLIEEGKIEGIKEGKKEGIKEGESYINRLNSILLDAERLDDLAKATKDHEYQKKLIRELVDENYNG